MCEVEASSDRPVPGLSIASRTKVLLLGNGGHADVVDNAYGGSISARVVAPGDRADGPGLMHEAAVLDLDPSRVLLLNGVGFVGRSSDRRRLFELFRAAGFDFATVVDPTAEVRRGVEVGHGCQILMGAMLNTGCTVGPNTIVNSGALVEHHVTIGAHAHVGPRATICGDAVIGDGAFIGAGAVVIQGVTVPPGTIVGAGAVVTRSYPLAGTLVGTPAAYTSPSGPNGPIAGSPAASGSSSWETPDRDASPGDSPAAGGSSLWAAPDPDASSGDARAASGSSLWAAPDLEAPFDGTSEWTAGP